MNPRRPIVHNRPPPSEDSRRDVRMDGVSFFRSMLPRAFRRALDPGNYSYCVMVRSGRLKLETDFPATMEIELGPGDAVAVSGLAPHSFKSVDAPPPETAQPFKNLALIAAAPRRETELVIGMAPNVALALGSLMIGPIVVRPKEHPELSRRLWRAVEMLEDEYADDSWIDRNLVIRRLAEIMLVNMTRRVFADRRSDSDATVVPASRRIMHAINAFFATPEKPWTLADLARVAGMSRTRFAEEFKLVTGQTPVRIISRMRLTAIARRLTSAPLSVEAAAEEAGYSSSAAFVRAFQREFGETPARWRRARVSPREVEDDARRRASRKRIAPRSG